MVTGYLWIACREGRCFLLCPQQPPPGAPPSSLSSCQPFLSHTLWGPWRPIAHLSSTPELINLGSDLGALCLLSPPLPSSAKSPERLGGRISEESVEGPGGQQSAAFTFRITAVSMSSCRSRHSLASGALTASRACQGQRRAQPAGDSHRERGAGTA